ncbi:MAG: peroxiredoxin family protein [Pyrinomonadaceae bacterium]
MSKISRANIDLALNILITVAIVVVAVVVVKRYVFPPENPGRLPQITKGERLDVPNIDWQQNEKTLVFFLKKDCVYCTSNAPFYRQLIEDASKRNVKWLAILPDSIEEGKEYLKSLALPIENVQSGSLSSYKIPGTPSVLFVDRQGIVKSVWIGAVPGQESQMRAELTALFNENL